MPVTIPRLVAILLATYGGTPRLWWDETPRAILLALLEEEPRLAAEARLLHLDVAWLSQAHTPAADQARRRLLDLATGPGGQRAPSPASTAAVQRTRLALLGIAMAPG